MIIWHWEHPEGYYSFAVSDKGKLFCNPPTAPKTIAADLLAKELARVTKEGTTSGHQAD